MALLNTVGLEMPDDFPSNAVWRAHERVAKALGNENDAWREFGGGWNGMAYRSPEHLTRPWLRHFRKTEIGELRAPRRVGVGAS
jgi:hypothetical protein